MGTSEAQEYLNPEKRYKNSRKPSKYSPKGSHSTYFRDPGGDSRFVGTQRGHY